MRNLRVLDPWWLVVGVLLSMCACGAPKSKLTPLEIQALQTRHFDTTKEIAFRAVMSVFQDNGYTISSADLDTGLVVASSATEVSSGFLVSTATTTRATATVEEYPPGKSHVRINLVSSKTVSGGYGDTSAGDEPILDPTIYDNLFTRLQEAVFLRTAAQ